MNKEKGLKMKNFGKARVFCVNVLAFCAFIATSSCFAATRLPATQPPDIGSPDKEEFEESEITQEKAAREALASYIKLNEEMAAFRLEKAQEIAKQLKERERERDSVKCDSEPRADIRRIISDAFSASFHRHHDQYNEAFQLLSEAHQDALKSSRTQEESYLRVLWYGDYAEIDDALKAIKDFNTKMLVGLQKALGLESTEEKKIERTS